SCGYRMAWTVSSTLLYETDLPVAAKEESAKQRIRARRRVFTVKSSQIVFGQRRRARAPARQPARRRRYCHNSSSMYNVPGIGFVRYAAMSLNPRWRYMATASFITGWTVSRRIRLYPILLVLLL